MRKQVIFSAQMVIAGELNLELDQVGVLQSIAMTLAYFKQGESPMVKLFYFIVSYAAF